MTVGEVSRGGRGYYLDESDGALIDNSFEIGSTDYQVRALIAGPSYAGVSSTGLAFWTNNTIPSYADYTLEFAGETLPLADATRTISGSGTIYEFLPEWMTANASTLSAANFETTLPVDKEVPACLRTATQVCPGGTTTTSSDATLSGLAVHDGATDHTIDPANTPYTLNVGNAVTTVTLTATPTHTGASVSAVTLGGSAIADTVFTDGITVPSLAEGANVIVVTVTAEDTTTMKTYMVTVTRAATTLTAPAIVANGVQVTSTPTTGDTYGLGETIEITVTFDTAVTVDTSGGTPRIRFILNGGPNPVVAWAEYSSGSGGTALEFTYTVQAGDKDDDGIWLPANFLQLQSGTISDTAYPTVAATLTYARPGTQSGHKVNAPSSDATLSGLAVHDGTTDHTIDLATTPYTLNVGSAVTTVTLTATPAHSGASVSAVTLGGTAIADTVFTDGITVPSLVEGANVIVVTVTAQDTTTTQTYTVTVTRAAAEAAVVWSTTMTVGETTGLGRGYRSSGEVRPGGSLDTDSFTITTGGVPYTVLRLEVSDHQGGVEFKLNSGLSSYADYTLEFAGETLPLVSAANIANNQERFTFNDTWLAANAPSLSLANFETTLAVDKEVPVCLRTATQVCPGGGTTVTNTAATGTPEISGVPQVGQVLTATAGTIADTDGLPSTFPDDYSVQWLRVDADGTSNEEDIAGEIAETYTLTDDDVGKKVKVKVSFTDDLDSTEMRTSAAYPSSGTVAGTNTAPTVSTVAVTSSPASGDTYGTGEMIQFTVTFDQAVTVVGTPEFEFCLGTTATVSCDVGSSPPARRRAALSSGSGTTALVFSYTVVAGDMDDNGIWIGDQSRTIKLDAAGTIQGTVGGLDAVLTHAELGAKTGHKVNGATANTPATGQPEISGTPQVGETLTAATTGITDADGKTNADNGDAGYAYTYEWVRVDADGVSNPTDITGATGSTYPPVEADVDKKVRVKVSFTDDGGTTETVTSDAYPSTGTIIGAGICGRTQEVQDEILEETSSISDCADVERHHLSAFTELYLDNDGITALAAGDFAGLTRVRYLYLHGNDELTSLPEGVFAGLLSLERLSLAGAGLTTLSAGVFEPLTALKFLSLVDNDLRTLTAGVFDGLDALEELKLEENGLTTLPAGVFDGLDALETLSLYGNGLTTLPAGVFDGLDALKTLKLEENGLTTLPAGVFDGLDALETLHLHDNALDALSAGVFEPLTALTELMLEGNPRAPFAPEAVALPDDGTVSDAGGTVTLDGSSSDGGPWGTNVTYGWALPDPASGVTIDDDTSVTPEATIPALTADTELTFTLTVTGRGGENGIAPGTDTATVRVTRADNTAPTAADSSVTIDEDTAHPFAATEFNFADTDPGDALVSVTVVTLPAAGALTLDGTAVTAGRVVPAADIGKLTFTPAANGNGLGYASFTFRVSDGTDESASAYPMTVNVTAVNDPATGKPEISGTPQVGQPLTADVSGIMDADGLTNVSYTYQWYGETQGLSAQISGATLSTYTPVTLDVGKTIKVEVSFTDDAGNAEAPLTSDATATVAVPTAPGVTVSTTALTVTEQDSTGNSYTVVLDTEPTANVVVTVAGHAGTDVTPNPTTLTFTSTIWSTAQTVTVTAGDDADTTDDSVALTHSAASADSGYSGIAIDEVAVTVSDNDTAGICQRTPAVIAAILNKISSVSDCANVTDTHLAAITGGLPLSNRNVTALAAGDFAGLGALTTLRLHDNALTTLPDGVFAGLDALTTLRLHDNALTTLPDGVFAPLTALTTLNLYNNALPTLPDGVFAGLDALTTLSLSNSGLATLPAGVFAPLTALTWLSLSDNDLTALPAGVFVPLTALTKLRLHNNALTALPAGVFAGLNTLTTLWLNDNALTALPAGVFAGLDMLTTLWLDDNALTALPDDVFEPLTALTELKLANNSGGPFGPDAVALPDDGTVSNAGGTVTLDGSGSNGGAWGTNVTYGWALTNPASGVAVTFDDDTSVTPKVTVTSLPEDTELTFTLTVTGRGGTNGIRRGTDTATVTATASPASDDATLESLTVSDGTSDLTLAPPFAPGTFVYAADVANAVTMVTLTAETTDDGASVSAVTLAGTAIADNDFTDGIMVPSLLVGDNAIMVRVTAEDTSTTRTYEVTVTRATPPGVTVSTTALTVTEQNTTGDSYTVVLDTQPTADVTVTVAGHAGTDVTRTPGTLTFTTSNWDTAQTVTVTAGDDADTTDDSVTLTHSAASTDTGYSGITIAGVTVTVRDNDTAQVTGVMVTSGNAQLVVNWAAVDNATGYKVQWKSGGQGYNGSRQFTVTSGSTTSHTITGLANGTEYTVRVSATRTGANDGPASAEKTGTPAVPTAPGVTVSKTALTVTEQDSTGGSYTVALDTEPTANVTVTVAGHAGTDVTPNPTTLTFTTSNWDTVQTVTVTAGDDADTTDDTVALTHSAASADSGYSGIAIDERGGDGERQRHRAGDGADGHTGQRATGGELDGGGQRHGLQGAVEVGQPGLQHRQPAVHGHLRFDHEPHDHGPRQRHRVHGAGERDPDRRQRRPGVGGEDGHAGRADRAGGHGVEDGADGDGAGLDREQLHGGAGYRADGECRGDGRRARGHGRDPGPGHPDVHRVELEHRADGDGDRGRRCGHHGRYGRADPQRGERGHRLQRHRDRRRGVDGA